MTPKTSLEQETREALIARAKKAGIEQPAKMTRVELLDELTKREHTDPGRKAAARGLLGRARDLIAAVLEKGLNLPDAADRLRELAVPPLPPVAPPTPTVTLAEIYAAQGHVDRAVTVLDEVLRVEPEHEVAQVLLTKLTASLPADRVAVLATQGSSDLLATLPAQSASDAPVLAADTESGTGPIPMLDDAPLPTRYGVNEVVVLPVDPTTALVYWEISDSAAAGARIRIVAKLGEELLIRELFPDSDFGEMYVYGLPAGASLLAEVVFRRADERVGVATSNIVGVPFDAPSLDVAHEVVVWGAESESDDALPPVDAVLLLRFSSALANALSGGAGVPGRRQRAPLPRFVAPPRLGSSELSQVSPAGSSELLIASA